MMTLTELETWPVGETRDGLRYDGHSSLGGIELLYFTELSDVASHGATFCLKAQDATPQGIAQRRTEKAREFAASKSSPVQTQPAPVCWNAEPQVGRRNDVTAGGTISTGEVLA